MKRMVPYTHVRIEDCPHDRDWDICGCGLRPGDMQIRHGVLVSIADTGRMHLRAERNADVIVARRVAAALRAAVESGEEPILTADIISVKEKS